jgi:hypothetical protein
MAGGIVTEHVKKRLFTAIEYRLGDEGDEIVCIAVTALVGMGAHGADFREPVDLHALARHGDEPALHANPQIVSQLMGTRRERARSRRVHQLEHFRGG